MGNHWPLIAGMLAGLLLLPVIQVEYNAWKQARHRARMLTQPVITAHAVVVERDDVAVLLRITGHKHRQCAFLGVVAIEFTPQRQSDTTVAERVDKPLVGVTRPVGPFDAGLWRMRVERDHGGMLEAVYDCEGVSVRNLLARVDPQSKPYTGSIDP